MSRKNYLLALLSAVMVFNYVDRIALATMIQNIKVDLKLTDTDIGLLTGIAFAAFYSLMGIPIARWADRGDRVRLISITVALWSIAVGLCGRAASFLQLLMIRIGVAVGEAGCHPPAFSLISDYFNRAERPRAVARYMLAWPIALLLGFFAAGWLNELYGWRATFMAIAAPGLCLAVLAAFTLSEPRRAFVAGAGRAAVTASPQPPIKEVFGTLWRSRAYRHLLVSFALSYFFGNGILQWQPAFFMRSYGLRTGEIGTWFAMIYGLGGLLGTYLGGEIASRCAGDDERLQFRGLAALYAALAVLGAGVYLVPGWGLALGVLTLSAIGAAAVNGPLFAATQTLVPARMRAMSIAIVLFFSNLIGLGLGPLIVGMLSDALRPWLGHESLRYALLALCPGYLWCTWHLWRASRTIAADLALVRAQSAEGDWRDLGEPAEVSGGI
jgi:predicted MFS family arabinose efflux permease